MRLFSFVAFLMWVSVFATSSSTAHAATDQKRVVLLPIEYDGNEQATLRTKLDASLLEGVGRGSVTLVPTEDYAGELGENGACDDACLRAVREATGAELIVRTSVSLRDRVYGIELQILEGDELEVAGSASERCEICGEQEVVDLLADQAANITEKLEFLLEERPMLVVSSTPPGASVFVDGELLGTTPLTREIPTGEHEVRVELDGHIAQTERTSGVQGVEAKVDFRLEPIPAGGARDSGGKPLIGAGAALLAGGVLSAGGGAVLVAIDSNQHQGQCTGDDVDAAGRCRYSYDTINGGIAALAVGGAMVVTGAVLLGLGIKRNKASRASAQLVPGGAGLQLRF